MLITRSGVTFSGYQSASPGSMVSSFTDEHGASLLIDTATLVRMYELVKFDLERRGGWDELMQRVQESGNG